MGSITRRSKVTRIYLGELDNLPSQERGNIVPFPFAPHIRREGEPEISDNLAIPGLVSRDPQLWRAISAWNAWAVEQPDGQLLAQDFTLRQGVALGILSSATDGSFTETEILFWHKERFRVAERIRKDGFGDILDKYWPHNDELRSPPARDVKDWELLK